MIGSSRRPLRWTVAAAVAATALALSACSGGGSSSSKGLEVGAGGTGGTFMGFGMTPPQPRSHFTLTDDSGKPFDFYKETQGHPTFLYFGYTHCPDICPATMADIAVAIRSEPKELQKQTKVVFVTTDVKRDTGAVLKNYLSNFNEGTLPSFIGLTGTQQDIDTAQVASKIVLANEDGQQHSAKVLLFGVDDYARVSFVQSDNEQKAMAHDLPLIAK